MPRPRKPVELHKIEGTFRPHRHAERHDPAAAHDLTDVPPPAHLPPSEAQIWREILKATLPRILQVTDAVLLETFCRALARYRRGCVELGEAPMLIRGKRGSRVSPLVGELRRAETALAELGTRLGLAPAARIRLAMGRSDDGEYGTDAEFLQMFGPLWVIRGDRV